MFCLIRHPPIIAPIGAQWQALLTERLPSRRDGGQRKLSVPIPQAVSKALTSRTPGGVVDSVHNLIARCCRLLGLVPTNRFLAHPSGRRATRWGPAAVRGQSARRLCRNILPLVGSDRRRNNDHQYGVGANGKPVHCEPRAIRSWSVPRVDWYDRKTQIG